MSPEIILQVISQNLTSSLLISYGLILFLLILVLILSLKVRRLSYRISYKEKEKVNDVNASRAEEIMSALKDLEEKHAGSLQNVGVVRFNAFKDIGSELSFAIALLDGYGNGVVLSSLYGRDETRTFAKPVKEGKSNYQLSDEEAAAISKALGRRG